MWLFVSMKYVHDHVLNMYHTMGLWWNILHDSLCLFIAIWLCRTFLLGGEALKTAFFCSFFVAIVFFLMDEFDRLVLKPDNFF